MGREQTERGKYKTETLGDRGRREMGQWGENRGRGAVGGKQTEREKWMRQI